MVFQAKQGAEPGDTADGFEGERTGGQGCEDDRADLHAQRQIVFCHFVRDDNDRRLMNDVIGEHRFCQKQTMAIARKIQRSDTKPRQISSEKRNRKPNMKARKKIA